MKRCSSCKSYREFSDFSKNKSEKDGFSHNCKFCVKNYRIKYKNTIRNSYRRWYALNLSEKAEYNSEWYFKNKEKIRESRREYFSTHRRIKRRLDINVRLRDNLRRRINHYVKGDQKPASAIKNLGCSIADLKRWIESKFQEGMTWDNYGKNGWHIDHVKPLVLFDLTDRRQFLEACHYTNLQPLWAKDNLKKWDKF